MVFVLGVIAAASGLLTVFEGVDRAVEVKRTARLLKRRKKLPKHLRDSRLVSDTFLLTEDEFQKMKKCPNKCLAYVDKGSAKAKVMEPMLEQSGFGKKCRSCGHLHPLKGK